MGSIAARRFRCGSATRLSEADNGRPAGPAAAGEFNARRPDESPGRQGARPTFKSYDDLVDHCCVAWNKLVNQPWRIMSIGLRQWAHRF